MKKLIFTLLISLYSIIIYAQKSKTAIGLRFSGQLSGLTIKHTLDPSSKFEGILTLGKEKYVATLLYEKFEPIKSTPNLKWFYGIGGHAGSFGRYGDYPYKKHEKLYYKAFVLGVDGILGVDYNFKSAPINLSMDLKPFIDFYQGGPYFLGDGALSLRFYF